MAQRLFDGISSAGREQLPPVPRDRALDELAMKAVRIIEAGVPERVGPVDHLETAAPLATDLHYAVGFEERTRGVDDRLRDVASRMAGVLMSVRLLASDPALAGIGWAAGGPWSVLVIRARPLLPADGPALQSALEGGVGLVRPNLRTDPNLSSIAADVVADGLVDIEDVTRLRRAGGVPVHLWRKHRGAHLPTSFLNGSLAGDGPGILHTAGSARSGSRPR